MSPELILSFKDKKNNIYLSLELINIFSFGLIILRMILLLKEE